MLKDDEKIIHLLLKISPLFLIFVSVCITYYIITTNNNKLEKELDIVEKDIITKNKTQIKKEVERIYDLIEYEKDRAEDELKENIKNHVYKAHAIAMSIYKNNATKSPKVITKMIKDALRDIRFNDGRGYFFIHDLEGVSILHPILPHREGTPAMNLQDKKGTYIVKERLKVIKAENEGFTKWWWIKPNDKNNQYEKIGFSKYFEPLKFIIVTGEYIQRWEETVQNGILEKIQELDHYKEQYIFISDYDGNILTHFNTRIVGQNKIDVKDKNGYFRLREVLKLAKKGEGFISYNGSVHPITGIESKKTSFVKGLDDWKWAIVSGVYSSDTNKDIVNRQDKFHEENKEQLTSIMTINILTFTCLFLFSLYISMTIKKRFEEYKEKVDEQREELVLFNNNLENEVKKRTEQYQNAADQAQAANLAKSTFLANMSHEIRTPLNAILGFVNILKDNETDKEKSKYLKTIIASSNSLLIIISDILDFAKVESGKMTLDIASVNPHLDFGDIGTLFFAKAEDNNLKFKLYIDPYLPTNIKMDSLKIRQILTNLLSNAMKFCDTNGTVTLKIKYNHDNSTLFFGVTDTGIGIAKENHEKILQSFSQEENSTSRKYGGTGLGLSISSKILELMGSKLEIKSEIGKGSEFYFYLKVSLPDKITDGFSLLPNIKNISVALLCNENEVEQLNIMKEYLKSFGMEEITLLHNKEEITLLRHPLIILNSERCSNEEIQLFLDKGHSIIIIKTSLNINFTNCFNGKVVVIDPPFIPSSIHDALLELFMDDTKDEILEVVKQEKKEKNYDKKSHILIAEDNSTNQLFMSVIMKKLGLKFSFANDGLEAISMFEEGIYDLILMDENMPNMNGTEAAKNILALEKKNNLKHTPIISLTANAIKGDREKFLEAGMDEYLSKPVVLDDLILILSKFLPESEVELEN